MLLLVSLETVLRFLEVGKNFFIYINKNCFFPTELEEKELESMALHETQDSQTFQKFKKQIATELEQVCVQ